VLEGLSIAPERYPMMLHAVGQLCTVDVAERTARTTAIDDVLEAFIGGRGVATKLAHDRIPFDADPFGPENRAYVTTGPLQLSTTSFTGRTNMTAISPLTDGICSTNAGGYVSRNLVATGYPAVELTGASDELLAVHVRDDGVSFEPVPELAGATVPEVTEWAGDEHALASEHLLTIGPAGENLVRFASVMTTDTRAFGRGGLGAVLGSKGVKCVTFDGDATPSLQIDETVQRRLHRDAATADDPMKRQGTTAGTEFINDEFSLPTRYFAEQAFEGIDGISGDRVEEKKYQKAACSVCAFACKLPTRDEARGIVTEGPEFETLFSFGSNCAIDDIVDVMQSNDLCDRLGMDTISAGNAVAAYLAATNSFGDAELVHDLVGKIARREDEGDLLAEGIDRFHDELGVENWTVKGLDFAAHDGRVLSGQALSYAVASRGGDHMYSSFLVLEYDGAADPSTLEGKPERLIERENWAALRDSGIVCAFSGDYLDRDDYEALFETDYEALLDVGARVVELERHFLNRRGVTRADDTLPYESELDGFERALDEYYERRGWTPDGVVPDERITESEFVRTG
jgi:aldehyde:ferredoxin oxidoreductase